MITNKGNEIIIKQLLGQVPEFASYIAIGVGATPLANADSDESSPTTKSLAFEAFRIPVTSRGVVNDTYTVDLASISANGTLATATVQADHTIKVGDIVTINMSSASAFEGSYTVSSVGSTTFSYPYSSSASWTSSSASTGTASYYRERLVFKGQLPADQRYEMTEIGIFPAASNPLALNYDSKVISSFSVTEGWTYYNGSTSSEIPLETTNISDTNGNLVTSYISTPVYLDTSNEIFAYTERKERYEVPRFLDRCLAVRGDLTEFASDAMAISASMSYVTTNNVALNASKNSPNDYIKIALSVVGQTKVTPTMPTKIRLAFHFLDSVSGQTASVGHIINSFVAENEHYFVISKQIKDFITGDNFSWSRVDGISIYAQALSGSTTYSDVAIMFDGIRLDNENTENPLYGLIAYSRLKNSISDSLPIQKAENSQGYIEYRMGVGVF